MDSEFVIIRNGKLESYERYEDIPDNFQHVIKFKPYIPPPPHTEEQHEEIESWGAKLNRLLEIEKQHGSSSSTGSTVSKF